MTAHMLHSSMALQVPMVQRSQGPARMLSMLASRAFLRSCTTRCHSLVSLPKLKRSVTLFGSPWTEP